MIYLIRPEQLVPNVDIMLKLVPCAQAIKTIALRRQNGAKIGIFTGTMGIRAAMDLAKAIKEA